MTYNTIPIPQFSFTDIPEREADQIVWTYFKSTYNIGYDVETAKSDIRDKLIMQDSSDDKIVILSYLINKLTERILTLPEPKSDRELGIRNRETIPTYTALLHFLYRLIEKENIKIPTDLFDEESYKASQTLLTSIHDSLEKIKNDNPEKADAVTAIQNEIKKSRKFLWLGKEDWAKILLGALVSTSMKEEILPLLPTILGLCKTLFTNLLTK